jgi:hypothetical protein
MCYTNTMKRLDKALPMLAEATYGDFIARCWALECRVPEWALSDYQAIKLALSANDTDVAFLLYSDYYSKGIRYLNEVANND